MEDTPPPLPRRTRPPLPESDSSSNDSSIDTFPHLERELTFKKSKFENINNYVETTVKRSFRPHRRVPPPPPQAPTLPRHGSALSPSERVVLDIETVTSQPRKPAPSVPLLPQGTSEGSAAALCERCHRCACESCRRPRTLQACDTCVDVVTCMPCVRTLFGHLFGDCEQAETVKEEPCACTGPHTCLRWICLASLTPCIPCLLFHWPLRAYSAAASCLYDRCSRPGCRCPQPQLESDTSPPELPPRRPILH